MQYHNLKTKLEFRQPYLPTPRHRKPHYREAEKEIKLRVKILTKEETPIAFKLTDYSHVSDNKTEIRYHSGHFYKKMNL